MVITIIFITIITVIPIVSHPRHYSHPHHHNHPPHHNHPLITITPTTAIAPSLPISANSRLAGYLSSGRVAVGGKYDRKSKWVEPTILVGVKEDSKVMQDEVFGPILPILNYENYQDAINFINKG